MDNGGLFNRRNTAPGARPNDEPRLPSPMKLATYKDGSRDGQLVVVSRDLSTAHYATGVAHRLQQVLDDWNFLSPQLQDLYDTLNGGKARHAFAFDPRQCMAPLPRAYQWVVCSAYPGPATLPADAAPAPPSLAQCASDHLLGAHDSFRGASEAWDIDFGAGLAVVTADLRQGSAPAQALEAVRLLLLANTWRLHAAVIKASDIGAADVHSRPASAFSPVAVTPDELGDAWSQGRVRLTLQSTVNGRKLGLGDAAADMQRHFGQLLAQLCRTRHVRAGTLLGSGTVSSAAVLTEGCPAWPCGCHSIADKRKLEILQNGVASTGFLKHGDTVRIEMKGRDGSSVFGAIEQDVAPA